MYCEAKGYICRDLKNSVQESLGLALIFIPIILRLNKRKVWNEIKHSRSFLVIHMITLILLF
jgi:hypothetical protein